MHSQINEKTEAQRLLNRSRMSGTAFLVFIVLVSDMWRSGTSEEGCPEIVLRSWHFSKVHNKTCYVFVNEERYWNDARSACWNMGGEMLSIKEDRTMRFIRSMLNSPQLRWSNEGVWLGARYVRSRWRWTTGIQLQYENWAQGEPSKLLGLYSVEDCALMRRDDNWLWHDYICGSMKFHYNYICEFPISHHGQLESQSGPHLRDNGNTTVLTIILVTGGILLLILLLVFIIVNRKYNYKKFMKQPEVHFHNRCESHAACQNEAVPDTYSSQENPPITYFHQKVTDASPL